MTADDAVITEGMEGSAGGGTPGSALRLAAVRATGLLDSEVEESFDRLTRLAVRLARIPAAFISLVDEQRDFYKSTCGFGEPFASVRELHGPTFCHYTILSAMPLVIPDTAADARYRDVPTVKSLNVAAYVGVPILIGGQPIGAFCAIDTKPRLWTDDEVYLLTELAITAQREIQIRTSERAARESEDRLRAFIEAVPLLAWLNQPDGTTTFNRRWYEYSGHDEAFTLSGRWMEIIHPEDVERVRAVRTAAIAASDPYEVELRLRRWDGMYRWHVARVAPSLGEHGEALSWAGGALDVDDRRRLEAELLASEARFRMVQDASPDGAVLLQPLRDAAGTVSDFRFTYANDSAHRILVQTSTPIVGRTMREAFPESAPRVGAYARVLDTGEPFMTETHFTREDVQRGLRITAVRVGDSVHVAFADLTERLSAEAERERLLVAEREAHVAADTARHEAEQANAVKAQFLATMSHELRTPLNAISGYAQLIELGVHGPVTSGQADALARIQRSQKHLLGLVTEVLNYAKLEAGAVVYHLANVPAIEIVRGVEALVAPQARAKELVLVVEAAIPELAVRADPEKARQIVLNLLSNAVKFTAPGGRVHVRCDDGAATPGASAMVEIRVEDTGRGIPPDQLAQVFDPFVQVGRQLTSDQAGTGLGLAISRDLARGMGGDVVATSEEGVGSLFVLTLPRA